MVDRFLQGILVVCVCMLLGIIGLTGYGVIGTEGRVAEIKERAPLEMQDRGWELLRYEGYQRGSFGEHGGRVWYHVRNIDNHSIQYRVMVTLWNNELHYTYGAPEKLNRINLNLKEDI